MASGAPSNSRFWCFYRVESGYWDWGLPRPSRSHFIILLAVWPWAGCLVQLSLFLLFHVYSGDAMLYRLMNGISWSYQRTSPSYIIAGCEKLKPGNLPCGCLGPRGQSFLIHPSGRDSGSSGPEGGSCVCQPGGGPKAGRRTGKLWLMVLLA